MLLPVRQGRKFSEPRGKVQRRPKRSPRSNRTHRLPSSSARRGRLSFFLSFFFPPILSPTRSSFSLIRLFPVYKLLDSSRAAEIASEGHARWLLGPARQRKAEIRMQSEKMASLASLRGNLPTTSSRCCSSHVLLAFPILSSSFLSDFLFLLLLICLACYV